MDALTAVLVGLGLVVLAVAVLAAPVMLLVLLSRQRPDRGGPPIAGPRGPIARTDDDEIAARHHR